MRRNEEITGRSQGVLDAPEEKYVSEKSELRRVKGAVRRDLQEDFAQDFSQSFGEDSGDGFGDEDFDSSARGAGRRRGGVQKKSGILGRLPRTVWGRVAAGVSVVAVLGLGVGAVLAVKSALLHDERFVIPDSTAIAVEGNRHVTKAQLLSIFGEDVDRNIFRVSLAERRAELERLPWVEHATVMRLLPDHVRVSIVERTPVAFVRQGNRIGLVDQGGVLMNLVAGAGEHYSFPVVTGISAEEPVSTRAARMKIFERFTTEVDAGGGKISDRLSEVDLSSPEDVKAVIPDDVAGGKGGELLVHFGDSDFLDRYNKYKAHLTEWRTQYPRLASVDMRYDRQAVLEMQPGAPPVVNEAKGGDVKTAAVKAPAPVAAASVTHAAASPVIKAVVAPQTAGVTAKPAPVVGSTAAVKTGSNATGKTVGASTAAAASPDGFTHHLMVAKDVPANRTAAKKPVVKKTTPPKAGGKASSQTHPAVQQ